MAGTCFLHFSTRDCISTQIVRQDRPIHICWDMITSRAEIAGRDGCPVVKSTINTLVSDIVVVPGKTPDGQIFPGNIVRRRGHRNSIFVFCRLQICCQPGLCSNLDGTVGISIDIVNGNRRSCCSFFLAVPEKENQNQ